MNIIKLEDGQEVDLDAELFNYDGFDCGAENCCGGELYPLCEGGETGELEAA